MQLSELYSDQYGTMHAEAHKRGILALGAPAFSWQLGYLVEADTRSYTSVDSTQSLDTFSEATIETYAQRMFESIVGTIVKRQSTAHMMPNVEAAEKAVKASGPKSVFLSVDDILVKLTVGDHSDHFTVTITVDLSKRGVAEGESANTTIIRLGTPGRRFRRAVRSSYAALSRRIVTTGHDTAPEAEQLAAVTYLKDGLWEDLYENVFAGSLLLATDWPEELSPAPEVFADFRSVVLNSENPVWMEGDEKRRKRPHLVAQEAPFASNVMKAKGLSSLLPLFDTDDPNFRYRELIACTVFRERAVYMSPLGSSPSNVDTDTTPSSTRPIYFGLAVAENNRWQIGRMVRRINSMGCLRLLALRDLAKIKVASDRIRQVGNDLDNAFLNQTIEVKEKEPDIEAEIQELATFKKEIDEIGANIAGHLPYRVYRSQFRSEQFREQVKDLFVERIEAWQPYDEFVRRRLYPTFDFISRVGQRYEQLNRNYQSKLEALNLELQSVSSSHLVRIQDDILKSHSFQHIIETIALAYYGGYILYNIGIPAGKWVYKNVEQVPVEPARDVILFLSNYLTDGDSFKMMAFALATLLSVLRLVMKTRKHRKR